MAGNEEESERMIVTSWPDLDASVTCLFDLYMARLDPFERYSISSIESLK